MGRKKLAPGADTREHAAGLSHLLAVGPWASHLASESDFHLSKKDDHAQPAARLRCEPATENRSAQPSLQHTAVMAAILRAGRQPRLLPSNGFRSGPLASPQHPPTPAPT